MGSLLGKGACVNQVKPYLGKRSTTLLRDFSRDGDVQQSVVTLESMPFRYWQALPNQPFDTQFRTIPSLQNELEECKFQLETQQQHVVGLEKQLREKHSTLVSAREQLSASQQVSIHQSSLEIIASKLTSGL